jgi:hypothetical protein
MYIGLHIKYVLLLSDFNEFSGHICKNDSNINFYENSSSENRVVPCGTTDGQA